MKAFIFDIKRFAIHDGPGIRTTVFFKGCPLECWWCHNPEGQKQEPEIMVRDCISEGTVVSRKDETIGREVTIDEVMHEIEKELIFYEESGGGVTLSGGEPLMQQEFAVTLLDTCRERGIHTALDTCGYAPTEIFTPVIDKADLFLYDLKIIDDEKHRDYTGVSNRLIIDNLKVLSERKKQTYIRFTIIPGVTDTDENIRGAIDLVSALQNIEEIDLLPFYNYASEKYKRLNRENRMRDVKPPSDERLKEIKQRFEQNGFTVKIGG